MEFIEVNADPKRRFIGVCEVSQDSSTIGQSGYFYITYAEANNSFPDSEILKEFYENPYYIDQSLIICVYKLKGSSEQRRRMMITKTPETFDDFKDLLSSAADSVGVQINFRNVKVSAGISKKENRKEVKENKMFLYSLIEYYSGDVTSPSEQLLEVKEKILRKGTLDSNQELILIGSFLQEYLDNNSNYYRVASKFGDHLSRADLKLSTKLIPETEEAILLEFPFVYQFSDFYIRNAFVSSVDLNDGSSKGISIVCPKYDKGVWDGTLFHSTIDVTNSDSIENSLKETSKFFYNKEMVQLGDIKIYKDLVSYCIKCLLYISSSEPDLHPEKGIESKKKNLAKARKFLKNHCPFDIINVGYDFHGKQYSVDETEVRGHFRWQPCGVGLKEIKLIWIDEHTRHYSVFQEPKEIN